MAPDPTHISGESALGQRVLEGLDCAEPEKQTPEEGEMC